MGAKGYEDRIIDYLNGREEGSRVHNSIDAIELIDDEYFRVETNFTDDVILEPFDEIGVYYINKNEL